MIFNVEITETLSRVVKQDAEDVGKAVEIVRNKYRNGEVVLDSDNFFPDYTIKAL